jgi:inosose dehydratase
MTAFEDRIAGAPISWGVCEVPGWGWQYDVETVLTQMRTAGLAATEFGPDGFLAGEPRRMAKVLADHGLRAVGGFVPVVLHDPAYVPQLDLDGFIAAGADTLVLAAATGRDGYDDHPALDDSGWATLLGNLDRLAAQAAEHGITATLHPHVGTMVENPDDVRRVLSGSDIGLCLDTGHLLIGGVDPVALAREHTGRIRHAHLKDVDIARAAEVQAGKIGYTEAVGLGLYRPLGSGHIDIAAIVTTLERAGYDGWYVLEQDTVLSGDPGDDGPLGDVKSSIAYLRGLGR